MKKEMHKNKIKKRYIFCIGAVFILLVSYIIFLCIIGRNYTLSIFLNGSCDPGNVKVVCSTENIIRVADVREGELAGMVKTIDVEFESTCFGDVDVTVFYDDQYDIEYNENGQQKSSPNVEHKHSENSFHVTMTGLIYNRSADNFNGLWTIQLFGAAFMMIIIITCCITFFQKARRGDFTYGMVALGGFIFFLMVSVIIFVHDLIIQQSYHNIINLWNVLYSLTTVSNVFVGLTAIPLILFCLLVSISNIVLVRREGFHPLNLLGVLLGLAVVGGIAALFLLGYDPYAFSEAERDIMVVISTAISFSFCYLESLLVSTIACGIACVRYKVRTPMDYIIILGCAIRDDGTPTPILRGRIDRALELEREQYKKWEKHAKFVPSGGQGSDEVVSEAECMKRYLMEQGIPEEQILKEDSSVNTFQNMKFSKKVIEEDAGDLKNTGIAFSTTNYHVFRGYTLAEKLGMKVKGLSAKTKLYFFPNAFLREFIGLIYEQKIRHLFFMISGIIFFASLYFILMY